MKSVLALLITLHATMMGYSQTPSWQWAYAYGGNHNDQINSITRDHTGNLIVTGAFRGGVDFDPGTGNFNLYGNNMDAYIVKIDSNKNLIWAKKIGSTGYDYGMSVISDDSSNIYVTGLFEGTVDFDPGPGIFNINAPVKGIFILKLDSSGSFQWAKSISAPTSNFLGVNHIRRDQNCNLYLGGNFEETMDFDPGLDTFMVTNAGYTKVFVLKLNNQGEFCWVKVLGSPFNTINFTMLQDMDINRSGDVVLTGYFQYELDLDPGPDTVLVNALINHDAYICKLDSSGIFQWGFNFGNNDYLLGNAITFDSTNNVVAAGSFKGFFDVNPSPSINLLSTSEPNANYTAKFDSSGNYIWSQVIENARASGISCDAHNKIYLSGYFSDTTDFNPDPNLNYNLSALGLNDIFVLKLDSNGLFNWATKASGLGGEYAIKAVIGLNNDIYVAGVFNQVPFNFGTHYIQKPGDAKDCYVARLFNLQTGLDELPQDEMINVFPNPAVSYIVVEIDYPTQIIICDILGKVLFTKHSSSKVKTRVEFDISSLSSGIYLIKTDKLIRKFVKTR